MFDNGSLVRIFSSINCFHESYGVEIEASTELGTPGRAVNTLYSAVRPETEWSAYDGFQIVLSRPYTVASIGRLDVQMRPS